MILDRTAIRSVISQACAAFGFAARDTAGAGGELLVPD
jgi:hypothetical protein